MWWLVVKNNYREGGTPHVDGLYDVTVGSMRCSFNIQKARMQWQLHKEGEAAFCWSANISSEPLYSSLPATKCLYLQSACHFPLAGELVYYLAHIYLGKTFQFKSAGTTVALARHFPIGSKGQELSQILEGRMRRGEGHSQRAAGVSTWEEGARAWASHYAFILLWKEHLIISSCSTLKERMRNKVNVHYVSGPNVSEHGDDMDSATRYPWEAQEYEGGTPMNKCGAMRPGPV